MNYVFWGMMLLSEAIPVATPVAGPDWVKEMFAQTQHDFGTVARGAKAEYRFTLQNIYEEDIHILSAESSCGCTVPTVTKRVLKKWEKGEIVATVDTRSFIGHKEAAVRVKVDFGPVPGPHTAETILKISCFIRSDVVVQPGVIDFNSIAQGSAAPRKVTVTYAGRTDWRIVSIESPGRNYKVQAREVGRVGGQVTYELTVELAEDAPAGYIKDQLVLVTNDLNARSARVPVPIEGIVVPGITVRPSPLMLGVVTSGQSVAKHLVVQAKTPFKVRGVQCSDARFRFELPDAALALHLIPVTFKAGGAPGNVSEKIRIQTDAPGGGSLEVMAQVQVVAPESSASTPAVAPMVAIPRSSSSSSSGAVSSGPSMTK